MKLMKTAFTLLFCDFLIKTYFIYFCLFYLEINFGKICYFLYISVTRVFYLLSLWLGNSPYIGRIYTSLVVRTIFDEFTWSLVSGAKCLKNPWSLGKSSRDVYIRPWWLQVVPHGRIYTSLVLKGLRIRGLILAKSGQKWRKIMKTACCSK